MSQITYLLMYILYIMYDIICSIGIQTVSPFVSTTVQPTECSATHTSTQIVSLYYIISHCIYYLALYNCIVSCYIIQYSYCSKTFFQMLQCTYFPAAQTSAVSNTLIPLSQARVSISSAIYMYNEKNRDRISLLHYSRQ